MTKRKKKNAVAREADAVTGNDNKQVAQPVPKKSNKIMFIVLAVFLLVTAVEVYFVSMKAVRQSKRPLYVNSWPHNYKGCTSIGEYGNYIYAVDNTRGDVYKTNKQNGVLEKILSFPEGTYSAMEDAAGNIYVLTKNDGVFCIDGKTYKTKEKIKLDEVKNPIWMDIDSKGNFFVVSADTNTVVKYDNAFTKITVFGGNGEEKSSLSGAGKVIVGPNDNVYVMNAPKNNTMEIKQYDNDGKFIRMWPVTNMNKFDSLTNLAIAADGNVYINVYQESRINVYSPSGKYLGSFDSDKDKKFQIIYAASITGGREGLLYVYTHKMAVFKTIKY
ncbi:MAG: NHL repeat-containing protein [Spirochaetia bacterium]|nr:NHL repeat-containing protein [Spirochaetia bacterium]